MDYKPNFCCQCGDKIERVNWTLKSRRFCELCETDFGFYDWIPRLALFAGSLLAIFGFGSYWMRPAKSLNTVPNEFLSSSQNISKEAVKPANTNNQTLTPKTESTLKPPAPRQNSAPEPKTVPVLSNQPEEKVYFCGAETKKGTPCSRRVKGGGRCFQHTGQDAMLPPEKLVANQ